MLFSQRCAGCHTLTAAGTQGSANRAVRVQGPNLNQRVESFNDVIFAIRNGGFSGAIMPQNIVTGQRGRRGRPIRLEVRGLHRPDDGPAARLGFTVGEPEGHASIARPP